MSYSAKVLEDSVADNGIRLTTMEVTFPRFLLPEFNTHRVFSRNSASSRAIPTEKLIEAVRENPFIPEFNERVKGMGVGKPHKDQENCKWQWLIARDSALNAAQSLALTGVDKSRANRLLEPFMWHTVIVTATEWNNFYSLRCSPDAQPEFQKIALMMRAAHMDSREKYVPFGRWGHLPLVSEEEREKYAGKLCARISASRCARVSYDRHNDVEVMERTLERADTLEQSRHLSPFEHQAMPISYPTFHGNLYGWYSLRKTILNEDNHGRLTHNEYAEGHTRS